MRPSVNVLRIQEIVDRKYSTQRSAAQAWSITQSELSRLLSGGRGKRSSLNLVRTIAQAEGIPIEELWLSEPKLEQLRSGEESGPARFIYDLEDPYEMLFQLENWFSDLPHESRMRRQVVKAVMRALLDESFLGPQKPSRQWRLAMDRVEGWPGDALAKDKTRRR